MTEFPCIAIMHSATTLLFCVLCMVSYASCRQIKFEDCGGKVKAVWVDPCISEPCEIPRGNFVFISAHCVPDVAADKLRLSVYAEIAGIELPFPGMKRDGCVDKNITCPIAKSQDIKYVQKLDIKSFFPRIETVTKFVLTTNDDDGSSSEICCFKAPVRVV